MFRLYILTAVVALLLPCCSPDQSVGGGGGGASETVAVVGVINRDIQITVRSEDAFSVEAAVCSDLFSVIDTGNFHEKRLMAGTEELWRLTGLANGYYTVIIYDSRQSTASRFSCYIDELGNPEMSPDSGVLMSTGAVSGVINETRNDGTAGPVSNGTVFLKGTFYSTITAGDGSYELTGIPEGSYEIEAIKTERTYNPVKGTHTVDVSGDSSSVADIMLIESN